MKETMKLWEAVCTTDPTQTKQANVKGNNLTSIKPQYQIMLATEQFGSYGSTWGFKNIKIDYTLMDKGLVAFHGTFYYPSGEFEIINSISIWRDNAQTKIDDLFAKKVETDTLTKALSKLGFNADIFMGQFDDDRYVGQAHAEAQLKKFRSEGEIIEQVLLGVENSQSVAELTVLYNTLAPNIALKTKQAFSDKRAVLEPKEESKKQELS